MNLAFFDWLNIGVIMVTCTGGTVRIQYLNPAACALLGFDKDELNNAPIDIISCNGIGQNFWFSMLNELHPDAKNHNFEFEFISKQHQKIPVLITPSCLPGQTANRLLFVQNISRFKKNQEELLLMKMAVEQTANAVVITNPKGYIEYVNPKFTELTGYSSEELIGTNPRILQSGDTSPEVYQALWQILKKTGKWKGEIKNKKKNGSFYWAYESISAIKDENGEITHLIAIEEDISQRKKAESALAESEQRFRQMAAMTGEWLWEQDPEGYYIYSSVAVKAILGFSPEEIIGKHYTELMIPDVQAKQQPVSLIKKPFFALTNLYRHCNGHKVITESTGLPIKNSAGKLLKWRGVDRDITERKCFQDALIESEKRKHLIIESALNAIIIMDSCGIITDWNNQAEKMFGWSRDEAIGKRLDEMIIPHRFRQAHRHGLKKFLLTGQGSILNHLIEQTARRRNGDEFPIELSISPLKLGNQYIFSGFIHDISARKAAERTLRETQVKMAITQKEMEIAHHIQSSLLPSRPIQTDEFEVTGLCIPADHVGGDYFDFFYQDENNLDMLIADVSGHSIGPALFMVEARSALRTQANWQGLPAQTLSALNNVLFQDLYNADYFITMFYLQFNIQDKILSFANAGHPLPLLYDNKQNQCIQLNADGLIFGVRKDVVFEQKSIAFGCGDMLLLYTDGLIEAENEQGEFFGSERVCQVFSRNTHMSPQELIDEIIKQLKQFCHTDSFNDDISLLIFKHK